MIKNILTVGLLASLAACSEMSSRHDPVAEATIAPTAGNQATGTATFKQHGERIGIEVLLSGLTPGAHGLHIHEKGDCSAPDAMSAGGHFNPIKMTHGAPEATLHHAGDLGNAIADADGKAKVKLDLTGLTVLAGETSVVGRAVIVHASPDDFQTQPTGNAGKRVACGVITAKP